MRNLRRRRLRLGNRGWQTQWNQALEDLVRAYQSMSGTHESNTMAMLARDGAEAAKWGG
ncbi:ESAT-6-like protein esxR [Mycobacterium tuberculosis UT0105]|nr:ESAT-6-like protein esxR [Mycobacterium tuberculosis UT0105]